MTSPDNVDGIFDAKLRLGVVSAVEASAVRVNLRHAGAASGSLVNGARYGLGEVGEFVLIEGELTALLGRIIKVRLPERERRAIDEEPGENATVDAIAEVQLLGTVALDTLHVTTGVTTYPRLGDRVYSTPNSFLASVPRRMERERREGDDKDTPVVLSIGTSAPLLGNILITPRGFSGVIVPFWEQPVAGRATQCRAD